MKYLRMILSIIRLIVRFLLICQSVLLCWMAIVCFALFQQEALMVFVAILASAILFIWDYCLNNKIDFKMKDPTIKD